LNFVRVRTAPFLYISCLYSNESESKQVRCRFFYLCCEDGRIFPFLRKIHRSLTFQRLVLSASTCHLRE